MLPICNWYRPWRLWNIIKKKLLVDGDVFIVVQLDLSMHTLTMVGSLELDEIHETTLLMQMDHTGLRENRREACFSLHVLG